RAVGAARFRQDLLYRLNGFTIRLPPLRERRADIPGLVEHFIRLSNRELDRAVRLTVPEALSLLHAYDWPGNVRELQSTIRYAVVHAPGDVITLACLPEQFRTQSVLGRGPQNSGEADLPDLARFVAGLIRSGAADLHRRVMLEVDRVLLEAVLGHTRGNQVQASEVLGISRTTLRVRLRALGLAVEKQLLAGSGQGG
ncbi:MAG: sigma-54-dependent Fis family transcriptional regulator, partial [Gemmataceae bacterium]|nr:sigma-54-dependent Fis family transcriptional regulator [Gemmataceae bacterium]